MVEQLLTLLTVSEELGGIHSSDSMCFTEGHEYSSVGTTTTKMGMGT